MCACVWGFFVVVVGKIVTLTIEIICVFFSSPILSPFFRLSFAVFCDFNETSNENDTPRQTVCKVSIDWDGEGGAKRRKGDSWS